MNVATEPAVRSFDSVFIGGRWVAPATDRQIKIVSPITEETLASVPEASTADVDAAVTAARTAFERARGRG